jgi:c-di-GMP-binding flagellar brake protein YcgR
VSDQQTTREDERREFARYTFDQSIQIQRSGQEESIDVQCDNICFGGLMLYAPEVLPQGDMLELIITYDEADVAKSMRFHGTVIWSEDTASKEKDGQSQYRAGIQFMNVSTILFHELERFIHQYCKD